MALPSTPAGLTSTAAAGSFQFFTHILTVKGPIVGGRWWRGGEGGLSRNVGHRSVSRSKARYSEDCDLCPGRRSAMVLVSSHPPQALRSQH